MEERTEKDLLYEYLVDLTKQEDESNRYFSIARIFRHIEEKLKKEGITVGPYGKGYKGLKEVNIRDRIPRQKALRASLKELVDEGKAQSIIADIGTYRDPYNLYRAVI